MANHLISGLFSGLSLRALARAMGRVPTNELTATESASTLFRFFRSKHVRDLKLIFTTALFVLALHLLLVVLLGLINAFFSAAEAPQLAAQVQGSVSPAAPAGPLTGLVNAAGRFLSFFISYVGPGVPIYGVIVGWAYRTASTRLGIVDLFACEISTLCRVGTIFDIGKRYVDTYDAGPAPARPSAAASGKFVSQEEYFPVFDSNSRDLQQLEASVVNNITEFYTYMKSTRDSLRKLADMPAQPAAPDRAGAATGEPDAWHDAMLNVIYLLFLGYESARKAVNDLIEFQPARAERSIVILLTELKCYAFLRQHFTSDDLRRKRLELREDGYRRDIRKLYREVKASAGHSDELWVQARETLPVLVSRYNEALDDDLEANL